MVGFKTMKTQLACKISDMTAIESVARMLGKVHQATHVAVLSTIDFQGLVEKFQ